MKLQGLTPLIAFGLASCVSHPSSQVGAVFSGLSGQWDEEQPDSCKNPHVISFDDEQTTMFVTYAEVGWVNESDSIEPLKMPTQRIFELTWKIQLSVMQGGSLAEMY